MRTTKAPATSARTRPARLRRWSSTRGNTWNYLLPIRRDPSAEDQRTSSSFGPASVARLDWAFVQRKTPGSCLAGGFPDVSSLSGSEVTLSANVQVHRALVLELVHECRLWSRDRQNGSACELLVEEERTDFSRERQVPDRSPAGDHTNLG